MQRIGVFVCHCGSNIAATVDVKRVAEMALMEPGVVHAEDYQYMCSEAGQALIAKAIEEKQLTGLVICSCSPRMHEATFRKAAERAGLNPYMVEIANIREHCSWIVSWMNIVPAEIIASFVLLIRCRKECGKHCILRMMIPDYLFCRETM